MNWEWDYDHPERTEDDEVDEGDDFTPTNQDRTAYATAAVDAYYLRTRHELGPVVDDVDEWSEVLGDLLCDLRHLADSRGVDWVTSYERGRTHYLAEKQAAL